MVARGNRRAYLKRHPEPAEIALIVEVSDTTYHRDRNEKFAAYARAGIPVYWIVHLPLRRVEVYTDPGPEGYRTSEVFTEGQAIPVTIGGQHLGQIAVDDILPPPPDEPTADDNGAQKPVQDRGPEIGP